MDQSAILQMFHGNRGLMEQVTCPKHSKAKECVTGKIMAFRERLSEELQKEFDEVYDNITDVQIEEIEAFYTEGFRFGALIGMDIMNFENE